MAPCAKAKRRALAASVTSIRVQPENVEEVSTERRVFSKPVTGRLGDVIDESADISRACPVVRFRVPIVVVSKVAVGILPIETIDDGVVVFSFEITGKLTDSK